MVVVSFYDRLIPALLATVPNDRNSTISINRVSQSLIHIMGHINAMGQAQALRATIINSFECTRLLKNVSAKNCEQFAEIIMVFNTELMKIKLALTTLNWVANGS